MIRFLAVIVLTGAAVSQVSQAQAGAGQAAAPQPATKAEGAATDSPSLPPSPPGKTTILGGEIRRVDPVRDVITLKVFGQKQVKILFDERTLVFRDGKKISLRDLNPSDHAEVQTVLDGTSIFAVSIHMLSQTPEGDYQGKVMSYNPETAELTVSSVISRTPMKLVLTGNTKVVREGQPSFTAGQHGISDLVRGALVSIKFVSDKGGRGIATQIAILATPGADFVFAGNLTALDMAAGTMSLMDPRDDKSYEIFFNAARLQGAQNLRLGGHVMVNASFDGVHYVAQEVTIN